MGYSGHALVRQADLDGHALASLFGLDSAAAGKTWRGAAIAASRVGDIVQSSLGEIREMSGIDTPMTWCCGIKVVRV